MATSVKSKFAGLLRGLLRQLDDRAPAPAAPATPVAPAPANPGPSALTAAARPENFSTPKRPVTADGLELPLAPIVAALPIDLRAKLMSVPPAGATICLPAETVMSQLAFGAVKITFGELRQLAPGIFANSGGEHDNRPINLPLSEILSRLNPALLARRHVQKTEVDEDISGPFDGRGQGITFSTKPLKSAPAAPQNPAPAPAPAAVPIPAPVTPPVSPAAFNPPPRQVTPPTMSANFPPRQTAPTDFMLSPKSPANGNGNGNGNGHSIPAQGIKFSSTPVPPARPEPAAPSNQVIFVSLSDLAETWPEELRNEITRSNLANASVPLAVAAIEPGLKRGRVTMTWKQIRTLARPSSPPSPNDGLELELSLKVLAPVFLDAQKNLVRPSRKQSVSAEIPNLFFGFPQPAAETVVPPAPVPTLPKPRASETNFFGLATKSETELLRVENPKTDFLSRQAHPKDVVARAAALPGVAGAVVALPDGLRVASEVPADLNADTLAAFLPQIFDRVNQSSRELRMGPLNNLNFTVGDVPWKIFRVSSVYFAAFGRPGESLPTAQLAGLATELDRKKNQ